MKRKLFSTILLLAFLTFISCRETVDIIEKETNTVESTETSKSEETLQFVLDDLPNGLDFDGKEVKLFIGDYSNAYIDDMYVAEETGNRLSDTIYNMIHSVEDRLNVKLLYNYQTYTWTDMSSFQGKVISGIMAGDNSFDILFDVMNYSSQMLEGSCFINLTETEYINLDKPWYNQTVRENMPDNNIYFLSGQFSLANIKNVFAIYFNADLYESLNKTEDLYGLVHSGKWTLNRLEELIKDTYADLNGNNESDFGDRFGITFGDLNKYLGFIKSLGMGIFEKSADGYEFIYDNERATACVERLCDLVNNNINVLPGKLNVDDFPDYMISAGGGNYVSKLFIEGNSLFSFSLIADAATIVPSIDFSYGLLPYPKWDEAQVNYMNMLQRNCFVLIPATVSDTDAASAILEALSSESYRTLVPEYCEVSLKTRYSHDNDVSLMFDLVINSIVYDPGEIFANLLGTPSAMVKEAINGNNPNWASTIAKSKDILINKMSKITDDE